MATAKKVAKVPPLPLTMPGGVWPIPVKLVPELRASDGEDVFGLWVPDEWVIKINADADPVVQWMTLFHEWTHAVLWRSGVKLPEKPEDRVCDAMGAALAAMLLASED